MNHRGISDPQAGGAERTIREVGTRLARRGHELHLLCGSTSKQPSLRSETDILVHTCRGNLGPHIALPLFLREHSDADVVVDDLAHALPWFSPALTHLPGTVFFRHLHARTLPGQTNLLTAAALTGVERLYSRIYRSWPFVTESESSCQDLVGLGVSTNRIHRIAPGVDCQLFRPEPARGPNSLVYFGGLRRYKRPEHSLLVLHKMIKGGYDSNLTVVGDGPQLPSLIRLARELGVRDRVEFVGRVSDDRLAEIIRQSSINIHCSVSEGWCYSVMEAAASGVPTVGYAVPGIRESVRNGVTGLLVPSGDVEALARATIWISTSEGDWVRPCRDWAMRFSWDDCAAAWEAHLKKCAASLPQRENTEELSISSSGCDKL